MSGEISLTKVPRGETISLTKSHEKISLTKSTRVPNPLRNLYVGCGWDVTSQGGDDLDLSIVQLDRENREIFTLYYRNKRETGPDGSLKHSGDNLTGAGDGDDEVILIDLERVAPEVDRMIVFVNVYSSGTSFKDVDNAFIRIVNHDTNDELALYELSKTTSKNPSMLFGEIKRDANGEWLFTALGQEMKEKYVEDIVKKLTNGKKATVAPPEKRGFFNRLF